MTEVNRHREKETLSLEPKVVKTHAIHVKPAEYTGDGASGSPYIGEPMGHPMTGAGGDNPLPEQKPVGFTTPLGTGITATDDTLTASHHTGANIQIDDSGGVFLTSSGTKGIGLNGGDVGISGNDLALNSKGAMKIKAGSLEIEAGDVLFKVNGSLVTIAQMVEEIVSGNAMRVVGEDNSLIVGGLSRHTVAGDERVQISGERIVDIDGKHTFRTGGDYTVNTKSDMGFIASGESWFESQGKMDINTNSDMVVGAYGSMNLVSDGSLKLTTFSDMSYSASGSIIGSAGSDHSLIGSKVESWPPIEYARYGVELCVPGTPPPQGGAQTTAPYELPNQNEVAENENATPEDIIDSVTSKRQIPEYPRNAKVESGDGLSSTLSGYDVNPASQQAYDKFAKKNSGVSGVSRETVGTEDPFAGSSTYENKKALLPAQDLQTSAPTSEFNPSTKIAGVSLSELIKAPFSQPIPASRKKEVLAAHAIVLQNVLGPIRKAGFTDFTVTSAYRHKSRNHRSGYAIDLQVLPGKPMDRHMELAKYAAENLPVSQVFLERSGSGYTHVHIRAHPPGASGAPKLLTCGDKRCANAVSGLRLEWLKKRARG